MGKGYKAPKPQTKKQQLKEKAQKAKNVIYKSPIHGTKLVGFRKKFASGGTIENYNDQVKRKFGSGKL